MRSERTVIEPRGRDATAGAPGCALDGAPNRLSARAAALAIVAATLLSPGGAPLRADEGLWLVNQPPLAQLEERYAFRPDAAWFEKMQKSAVRFENGGSGSLVSADGLVLTNHHVGSDMLEQLSTPERNLLRDGFLARTRDAELKCPDLELRVLWSIEDVTDRVDAAATPDMDPGAALKARRAEMARIEQESKEKTGLLSDVVTLYQGGRYHLYRYKSYTDVRLVFAPESQAAFFGGDADNFEYPRFNLDMCLFRVYEGDKPLQPQFHLTADPTGLADGELALVFGHPGRTERAFTTDHFRFLRDVELPAILDQLCRREVRLTSFAGRGVAQAQEAENDINGIANSRKAYTGLLNALQNPAFMTARGANEAAIRSRIDANPAAAKQAAGAWDRIAGSLDAYRPIFERYQALERARGAGQLFSIARQLVRLTAERTKPSDQRLPEFRDSMLPSLELELFSPAPIHVALEAQNLASWLTLLGETLGGDDALVRSILGDLSPEEAAKTLVAATPLKNVDVRRRIAAGGPLSIDTVRDPLLRAALLVDGPARDVRQRYENEVLGPQRDAYGRLATARFTVDGESVYPDATFTLRLSYGAVKGYSEGDARIAPFTTLGGAFASADAHGNTGAFVLPKRWLDRKASLDLSTPFNFVLTADIIGGNSGSPVVNEAGALVGLIFDGNIQSLPWDYAYDDRQARAVAVDIRAILAALRTIYDAGFLADELLGKGGTSGTNTTPTGAPTGTPTGTH